MDLANAVYLPLMSIAVYIAEMPQVARKPIAVAVIPIVCKAKVRTLTNAETTVD